MYPVSVFSTYSQRILFIFKLFFFLHLCLWNEKKRCFNPLWMHYLCRRPRLQYDGIRRPISKTLSWALKHYAVNRRSRLSARRCNEFLFFGLQLCYKAQGHDVHSYPVKVDITDNERRQLSASRMITKLRMKTIPIFRCRIPNMGWQIKQRVASHNSMPSVHFYDDLIEDICF